MSGSAGGWADGPIQGMAQIAFRLGWEGPLADPDLAPVIKRELYDPPGVAEPDPVPVIGYLMLALHSRLDVNRWTGSPAGFLPMQILWSSDYAGRPDLIRLPPPRLTSCYRGEKDGFGMAIGTCRYWLAGHTAYGIPMPGSTGIGSGFCVVRLLVPYLVPLELVAPRKSGGRGRAGHRRAAPALSRTGAPAALVRFVELFETRKDWAFWAFRSSLVCVTHKPFRSGEDALALACASTRGARLLGDDGGQVAPAGPCAT